MFYTKKDLSRDINFIDDEDYKKIKIYKNGYLFLEDIVTGAGLKNSFNSLDFCFYGGSGLMEFYIILDNNDYIIQILENKVENVFEFIEILHFN